jgi:hypothetical protein
VTGVIQAEKVLDKDIPANRLLARLNDSPG